MEDNSKIPVSVIVMTKNEARNIEKCLRSLANFQEIFVVDSASEDATREIATRMGAQVVPFVWDGKYPKKKQWCLDNLPCKHDWALFVDADEELYPELASEIQKLINTGPKHSGYFVAFDYVFLGRVLKHGHRVYKLVLFNRHRGGFLDYDDLDVANMWEVEGHYQPKIDGSTGVLKERMLHHDHDDLFHFFEKLNKYSDWEAALRRRGTLRHPQQASLSRRRWAQTLGDRLPLRGLAMFVYSYFFRLGFLDGHAGFQFAVALGMYHAMISMKMAEAS